MTRILIAEDETRVAAFVAKGLRNHGYDPVVAEDGEQALQLAVQQSFGLLVLDLGLPIKDGWAVLSTLRQQGIHIPVIIVTARSDNGNPARALALGASAFLTKPFRFSALLDKVRSQLPLA